MTAILNVWIFDIIWKIICTLVSVNFSLQVVHVRLRRLHVPCELVLVYKSRHCCNVPFPLFLDAALDGTKE